MVPDFRAVSQFYVLVFWDNVTLEVLSVSIFCLFPYNISTFWLNFGKLGMHKHYLIYATRTCGSDEVIDVGEVSTTGSVFLHILSV